MDKTTFGLAGALTALLALPAGAANASEPAVPTAQSYAQLLEPIPNAAERLKLADAQEMARDPMLIEAQYNDHHHHHHAHVYVNSHHHHAHVYYRRRHVYRRIIRAFIPGPVDHHHHHHHHSHY